jgi:hypothetical protein
VAGMNVVCDIVRQGYRPWGGGGVCRGYLLSVGIRKNVKIEKDLFIERTKKQSMYIFVSRIRKGSDVLLICNFVLPSSVY